MPAGKTIVTLATATPGGGFPLYGGAVADLINAEDPTLDVQPKHTKGSTENVPLLEAGTMDIGLVQGEVVLEAPKSVRILAKHAFLRPLDVAAGSYPGITAPLASVGSWSFIMTRPTLPDDVAYKLARALHRGEAKLGATLAQARETTAANTATAAAPERLHPGVARYLREIGALR